MKSLVLNGKTVKSCYLNGKQFYSKQDLPWICFTAKQSNSTVQMKAKNPSQTWQEQGYKAPDIYLETSQDGSSWTPFVVDNTIITLTNIGDKVYFRAQVCGNDSLAYPDNVSLGTEGSVDIANEFTTKGKLAVSGNIMTLLNQNVDNGFSPGSAGNFRFLFKNNTALSEIDIKLPETELTKNCYQGMFYGCSSLTQAPELPSTTLAQGCYGNMFYGCSSLTQAPELPATTLTDNCYASMFRNCKALTQAPRLPATTLTQGCYGSMFYGCSSLTQAPELPATTLVSNCYDSMLRDCTSLTQAPELPATTLATYCYYYMFYGCSSLTQAPELPATTLAQSCYNTMFRNCTSLTQAPELPATTLASNCYKSMFQACSKLQRVKAHFRSFYSSGTTYATTGWMTSVPSTGTFICPESLVIPERGTRTVPAGWTIERI